MKLLMMLLAYNSIATAWTLNSEVDSISDVKSFTAYTLSNNVVWGGKKAQIDILKKCNEDGYIVLLSHPFVVGQGPVQLRLDKKPSKSIYADRCASGKCLFIGDKTNKKENPTTLVGEMKGSSKLLIRYQDAGNQSYDAEFSIQGLSENLAKFCK